MKLDRLAIVLGRCSSDSLALDSFVNRIDPSIVFGRGDGKFLREARIQFLQEFVAQRDWDRVVFLCAKAFRGGGFFASNNAVMVLLLLFIIMYTTSSWWRPSLYPR